MSHFPLQITMTGVTKKLSCQVLSISRLYWFSLIVIHVAKVSKSTVESTQDLMEGEDGNVHREAILDKHNYLRSLEAGSGWQLGAVYMLRLTYDVQLEGYAKNYARKLCQTGYWGHSSRTAPYRVAPGENLYVNTVNYSGNSRSFDAASVVQKWFDERMYFDWNADDPNKSASEKGKMIGHWTQVVRAEASQIGCWIITGCECNNCGKQNGGKWSTYMVCHYDYGNRGWFPYWPLAFPSRIPTTLSKERRQRCGNCPKGFFRCGVRIGSTKRDAYLCEGFWDSSKQAPPANLLDMSINESKNFNIPSWTYMVRDCSINNGGCRTNYGGKGLCWSYNNGMNLNAEPRILSNQCICSSFSTSAGIWFERDLCTIFDISERTHVRDMSTYFSFIYSNTEPAEFYIEKPYYDQTIEGSNLWLEQETKSRTLDTSGTAFLTDSQYFNDKHSQKTLFELSNADGIQGAEYLTAPILTNNIRQHKLGLLNTNIVHLSSPQPSNTSNPRKDENRRYVRREKFKNKMKSLNSFHNTSFVKIKAPKMIVPTRAAELNLQSDKYSNSISLAKALKSKNRENGYTRREEVKYLARNKLQTAKQRTKKTKQTKKDDTTASDRKQSVKENTIPTIPVNTMVPIIGEKGYQIPEENSSPPNPPRVES